jgi:hypothetical protein
MVIYIICITNAFTKYIDVVAIENKEAEKVSEVV